MSVTKMDFFDYSYKIYKKIFIPFIILILSFLYTYFTYNLGMHDFDDFIYANSARNLFNGGIPFRDYFSAYPGGYDIFNSVLFKFFGVSLLSMRKGGFLIGLTFPLCIYFISYQTMSKKYALITSLFTIFLLSPSWTHPLFYSRWLFFVSYALLLLSYKNNWHKGWLLFSGIATGLSLSFRQNGGLITSLFILITFQFLLSNPISENSVPSFPKDFRNNNRIVRFVLFIILTLPFILFFGNPKIWLMWFPIALSSLVVLFFFYRQWIWFSPRRFSSDSLFLEGIFFLGLFLGLFPLIILLMKGGVLWEALLSLMNTSSTIFKLKQYPFPSLSFGGMITIAGLLLIASVPVISKRIFSKNQNNFLAVGLSYLSLLIFLWGGKKYLHFSVSKYISSISEWFPPLLMILTAFSLMRLRRPTSPTSLSYTEVVLTTTLLSVCIQAWMLLPVPTGVYLHHLFPALIILGCYQLDRLEKRIELLGGGVNSWMQKFTNWAIVGFFFAFWILFGPLRGFFDFYPVEGKKHLYRDLVKIKVPTLGIKVSREFAESYEDLYEVIKKSSAKDIDYSGTDFMFSPKRQSLNFITLKKDPVQFNSLHFLGEEQLLGPNEIIKILEGTQTKFISVENFSDEGGNIYNKLGSCNKTDWDKGMRKPSEEIVDYIQRKYEVLYAKGCYRVFVRRI